MVPRYNIIGNLTVFILYRHFREKQIIINLQSRANYFQQY